jgi:hypothetical protein
LPLPSSPPWERSPDKPRVCVSGDAPRGTSVVPFVGVRLGSYPGAIAGTAGAALVGVVAAILHSADY